MGPAPAGLADGKMAHEIRRPSTHHLLSAGPRRIGCGGNTPPPVTVPTPHVPTVAEYARTEIEATNRQLEAGVLAKFTEDMHPGVTYREATLTSLRLTTIDGTNSAGVDGGNVSEVHAVFVVKWRGPVTQDGFTEVSLVYDRPAKVIKETKYLRSHAAINLNAIDWGAAGATLVQFALTRGLR